MRMPLPRIQNFGLKILALILAIVVYYVLKTDSLRPADPQEHHVFQQH